MSPSIYRMLFGRGGKPRSWTRRVLFRGDRTVRGPFRRFVYKKSGKVRPEFALWVSGRGPAAEAGGATAAVPVRDHPPSRVEEALARLRPFDETLAARRPPAPPDALLSADEIAGRLSASARRIILSAGRDTSGGNVGGVQLCLDREARLAAERGDLYLRFDPWDPVPALAAEGPDLPVRLVAGGEVWGAAAMTELSAAAERLRAEGREVRLVVHQLLGHSPEAITALRRSAGAEGCLLWLHDFFTLCPGYTLLRNRFVYCGAPEPASNACTICVYGEARPAHLARIGRFFAENRVEVVAPSAATADLWTRRSGLPCAALHVVPHVDLAECADAPPRDRTRPVTVGFLGAPYAHKGWQTFLDLMHAVSGSGVRFVVLSEERPMLGEDEWLPVRNTTDKPDAMVGAVRSTAVDLALIWPSGPETFSLTTHEALVGGAYVLTNTVSGNVQATVRATGRGAAFEDEAALHAFFADGSAARLAGEARAAPPLDPRPSALSFAVPGWS